MAESEAQETLRVIYDEEGNKTGSYFTQDGKECRGYYAAYDEKGRMVSEYDYEPNPQALYRDKWEKRYRMYTMDGNGNRELYGLYYAAEELFFLDGYTYESMMPGNNNVFRYYSYGETDRMDFMLELYPYESIGHIWVYLYDDENDSMAAYEYTLNSSTSMPFTCSLHDGGRIVAMNECLERYMYEYDGSKFLTVDYNFSDIVQEDAEGNTVQRFYSREQ